MKPFGISTEKRPVDSRKGVYVALLNQGEVRTELASAIQSIFFQQKYNLYLTFPAGKPITHNRNSIVQDFLSKPEYEYLWMNDADILPPLDILDLVDFGKDIISPVCFMWDGKAIIPLVMQRKNEKDIGDGKKPYESMEVDGSEGLIEVDAVGTGSIIIHRRVLEKMKYPFKNHYDENGIKTYGNDLMFCTNAKKEGFKVWCHLNYVAGHMVDLDLRLLYKAFAERERTKAIELKK